MKKIKATCEQLDIKTDKAIPGTVRIIGYFETVDAASSAAQAARKEGESVCIYNVPLQEEGEMSALEISENEIDWVDRNNEI